MHVNNLDASTSFKILLKCWVPCRALPCLFPSATPLPPYFMLPAGSCTAPGWPAAPPASSALHSGLREGCRALKILRHGGSGKAALSKVAEDGKEAAEALVVGDAGPPDFAVLRKAAAEASKQRGRKEGAEKGAAVKGEGKQREKGKEKEREREKEGKQAKEKNGKKVRGGAGEAGRVAQAGGRPSGCVPSMSGRAPCCLGWVPVGCRCAAHVVLHHQRHHQQGSVEVVELKGMLLALPWLPALPWVHPKAHPPSLPPGSPVCQTRVACYSPSK